jgi:hypothetical protein
LSVFLASPVFPRAALTTRTVLAERSPALTTSLRFDPVRQKTRAKGQSHHYTPHKGIELLIRATPLPSQHTYVRASFPVPLVSAKIGATRTVALAVGRSVLSLLIGRKLCSLGSLGIDEAICDRVLEIPTFDQVFRALPRGRIPAAVEIAIHLSTITPLSRTPGDKAARVVRR